MRYGGAHEADALSRSGGRRAEAIKRFTAVRSGLRHIPLFADILFMNAFRMNGGTIAPSRHGRKTAQELRNLFSRRRKGEAEEREPEEAPPVSFRKAAEP